MKIKLILIIGLLTLLILPVGLALADNGPHGNYTATTDACAGCHRTHTAAAAKLLTNPVPNLCYSCHGSTGSGANTNVVGGQYLDRTGDTEGDFTRGLKAGGFVNTVMATNWLDDNTGPTNVYTTTSSHTVDGSLGTVWGYGGVVSPTQYVGAANFSLSCTSCHDPHGGAGSGGAATYRLLRSTVPITGSVVADVTDETGTWWYTVRDTTFTHMTLPDTTKTGNQYFGEGYPNNSPSFFAVMDQPESELTPWCTQCHTRYLEDRNGSASDPSGDALYTYRHRSNLAPTGFVICQNCHSGGFPPPNPGGGWFKHNIECMTCHVAHGSSAQMTGVADSAGGQPGNTSATGSALLRVDNRGTCELCHGKGGLHVLP